MGELLNLLFGWKEVLVTTDEQKYYQIKDVLRANHIKSQTSIVDNQLNDRNRGTFLVANSQRMYYIYVKKENYEEAVHLMNS
ncbi:hypothetical protein [Fusibacter ferrireducens]|uniref:DUF2007 domain-containing protein n=1 Tax=Fusibacter ferrireducens TaxID=2785058 RepID=A0ABR9ZM71_9FIRM|nr:hypothetical protein [Fusibacter ferrireducens]MBF4691529.1 hypothetical protein [Fusibacter ferrireducens]